jgi:uncharacterized lipoprotein YmbA
MKRDILRGLRPHYRIAVAALLVALLAGCASAPPPVRYLQLSAGDLPTPEGTTPSVVIEAVSLPDYLQRDALVERLDANELRYLGAYRWVEPLQIAVPRVLVTHLASRLDSRHVSAYPSLPPGGGDWLLRISIRHFEFQGDMVRLDATVLLRRATEEATQTLRFQETRRTDVRDGPAIAAALGDLLDSFASQIATQLRAGTGAA